MEGSAPLAPLLVGDDVVHGFPVAPLVVAFLESLTKLPLLPLLLFTGIPVLLRGLGLVGDWLIIIHTNGKPPAVWIVSVEMKVVGGC